MLERRGHLVLEARHGADALALWRQHGAQIDTVLTDMRMPEMSEPVLVGVDRVLRQR
jgi:CheY-like chemotaxis protein